MFTTSQLVTNTSGTNAQNANTYAPFLQFPRHADPLVAWLSRKTRRAQREKVNLNTMDMVSGGDADWGKVHGERSILGSGSDFWCFYKEYMHRVLRSDRLKVFASWIQNSKIIIQRTKFPCIVSVRKQKSFTMASLDLSLIIYSSIHLHLYRLG